MNGTYGKLMNFKIEYQWQPCGGILEGLSHVISAPKNISYPINCIWRINYPDTEDLATLYFTKMNMSSCDRNYITIKYCSPIFFLIPFTFSIGATRR